MTEQPPDRNEAGEMANSKRTQVSAERETLREAPPAAEQNADQCEDEAGKKST